MKAGDVMGERAALYEQLVEIDECLRQAIDQGSTTRASAQARALLDERAHICEQLRMVGYHPQEWAA